MYKVFVVDDEVIVRESIRTQIDWEHTQFMLAGEASDGEMALSLIKDIKPDILITDIRMPFLDGLQLSRIVKQTMPWVRTIILSGHDEFDYAQKAISIGIAEYILKPIGLAELLGALQKAALSIEEERSMRSNLQALQAQLENSNALNEERLFTDILIGAVSAADAIERALAMGIDLVAARYTIVITEGGSDLGPDEWMCIRAQTRAISGDGVWQAFVGVGRLIALIKGDSSDALDERAYAYAQAVKYIVDNSTRCMVSIGIGSVVSNLSGIPASYRDADRILRQLGHVGAGKILGVADLGGRGGHFDLSALPASEQLKYAEAADIDNIIHNYILSLGEGPLQSMLMANYILMDVLLASSKLIVECGGNPEDVLPEAANPGQLALSATSRERLSGMIRTILERTFAFRDANAGTKYTSVIRKAQAYINENYADPDISLNTVAAHVSLSSNHFCTVFAQETGQTFIEYLTGIRLKHAKQMLLDASVRTGEVAYAVGYNDPHYFSYIFKKHTGISPREYRASAKTPPAADE